MPKPVKKPASEKPTSKKLAAKLAKTATRPILYPEYKARIASGGTAITATLARELMGWAIESENVKFGTDFLLRDYSNRKVRCYSNVKNRPLYLNQVATLKQEILRKRWDFNGEPIIIGKTGLVLNGQHTLIALILAYEEWEKHPGKWKEEWQGEPTIDKLVVYGVDESDRVVNTMDTCKPRSLADVLYRSEYFQALKPSLRKNAARVTDHAVRLLWHRTGASLDAFAPRRTHAESISFLERHKRLLEAVTHVIEENGEENRLSPYLSPGYASALLYLQGTSDSDHEAYVKAHRPGEEVLDFARWERALEFWTLLADRHKSMNALRDTLGTAVEDHNAGLGERLALLVKAWLAFRVKKPITAEGLELQWHVDGEGVKTLAELPICGGIDIGQPSRVEE